MNIDGKLLTLEQFERHVQGLDIGGANTVVIHHTAKPDEELWVKHGGWAYWRWVLKRYHEGLGWYAGPHCYIDATGIGLFTPLSQYGIGVTGHNVGTRHCEIVGDYTDHLPEGATLENAVGAAAALLRKMGTKARLTYHQDLEPSTECPGAALISEWEWFACQVSQRLLELDPCGIIKIDVIACRWLSEELRRYIERGDASQVESISLELVRRLNELERSIQK
jgi:hypothetical protein